MNGTPETQGLVRKRLTGRESGEAAFSRFEDEPDQVGEVLEAELVAAGAGDDAVLLEAVQRLLVELDPAGDRAGKVHGRSPWAAGQQGRRPRRPDRHVLGAAAGGTLSDGPGGGRGHDLRWTQGVQIGNHNTQINIFAGAVTFTAPVPVSWPVRVGAVPALADCYQVRDEASSLRVVIQCDAGHGPLDARSLQRTPGSGARLARPA